MYSFRALHANLVAGLISLQTLQMARILTAPNRDDITVVEVMLTSRYLHIHIDSNGIVDTVTYLGPVRVEVDNFIVLLGLSHFYLYHVLDKYDDIVIWSLTELVVTSLCRVFGGMEPSSAVPKYYQQAERGQEGLIGFLREVFTAALYHDRFESLRQHLELSMLQHLKSHSLLPSSPPGQVSAIVEQIRNSADDAIKKDTQRKLLAFLQEHHQQLHMYFIPSH